MTGRFNDAKIVSKLEVDARQNFACLFNPPAETQKWEHKSHWKVDSSEFSVTGLGPSATALVFNGVDVVIVTA